MRTDNIYIKACSKVLGLGVVVPCISRGAWNSMGMSKERLAHYKIIIIVVSNVLGAAYMFREYLRYGSLSALIISLFALGVMLRYILRFKQNRL